MLGYNTSYVGHPEDGSPARGSSDEDVLSHAKATGQVVVTSNHDMILLCAEQQESVVWRRELWEQAGGSLNLEYELAADMELWMRFFRHARLYPTTALLAGFRHTQGQRSRVQSRQYMHEARRIVASERIMPADAAALTRSWWFDRLWRRIPVVRKSWRVRRAYRNRLGYPPVIDFNHDQDRFEFLPETGA